MNIGMKPSPSHPKQQKQVSKNHPAILKNILLLLLFSSLFMPVKAQIFTEIPNSGPGMVQAKAIWFASGNRLHPIVSGQSSANSAQVRTVFLQQKSKTNFVVTTSHLPDFAFGALDAIDFNKDGMEDVALTGIGTGNRYISGVYLRQSNGTFVRSNNNLPTLSDGSIEFGDFDKDGDFDLLMAGKDPSGGLHTKILKNDNGKLLEIKTNLPGIRFGKARWGDFNNDGQLDVIITGQSNEGLITKIFLQKDGNFSPLRQSFTPLYHSDVAVADFNNDGFLDFFIAGQTKAGTPFTSYYLGSKGLQFNSGNNREIRQLMNASVDVGDYNNDGLVDVVMTGESLERPYTIVLQNQQGRGFRDIMAGLPGVANGTARWGDYDNDGDLDLYIAGVDVCFNLIGSVFQNGLNPAQEVDEMQIETIPLELVAGPKYYFVFSSCYCDPEHTGTKSYHGFVSNIHKERKDFDLNYEFNYRVINTYPGWNKADRGHRTSNAFTSVSDAENGRKTVIASYVQDNYTVHYINW